MLPVTVKKTRRARRLEAKEQLKFRSFHVKKGDTVKVLSGKDRGKTGRVLKVFPDRERVLVEKLNILKRHQKPNQRVAKGGIIEREGPIHISNVILVCKSCKEITRPRYQAVGDTKTRVCRKCKEPQDLK